MVARIRGTLFKWLLLTVLGLFVVSLTGCQEHSVGMLNPKGVIAFHERKLFFDTLALMLIVVLPVIIMSFAFVYHYQASHRIQDYKPNWGHSYFLEALWWGIPCAIIVILAVLTWQKTHELDPYNSIPGHNEPPILIQVIALPWKWLFIYPQQGIATINYLEVPVDKQVEYWMTADNVPMSAFFIPQLGSQIYVMAGMRTRLHLVADAVGIYDGLNTQFNGDGFSDMHFSVHVVTAEQMQQWVASVKATSKPLNADAYNQLLTPTINVKPAFFKNASTDLFEAVLTTYMNSVGVNHPRANLSKGSEG